MADVKRFIVQDSWDDEDDQDLRAHLAASGLPITFLPAAQISTCELDARTMIFADTSIVQQIVVSCNRGVVDTYPQELLPLFKRDVQIGRLSELHPQRPYFVKMTGSNKSFAARVVRTHEEAQDCASEAGDEPVYICEVRDFVSEHRLFCSPGRLWGMAEYSEWMIGHRMQNADEASPEALVIEDVAVPSSFVDEVLHCAAPLGFVAVDVGLTRQGEWCVVEANPPFALSSYDLDIGVYVDYCVAAWQDLAGSLTGLPPSFIDTPFTTKVEYKAWVGEHWPSNNHWPTSQLTSPLASPPTSPPTSQGSGVGCKENCSHLSTVPGERLGLG